METLLQECEIALDKKEIYHQQALKKKDQEFKHLQTDFEENKNDLR